MQCESPAKIWRSIPVADSAQSLVPRAGSSWLQWDVLVECLYVLQRRQQPSTGFRRINSRLHRHSCMYLKWVIIGGGLIFIRNEVWTRVSDPFIRAAGDQFIGRDQDGALGVHLAHRLSGGGGAPGAAGVGDDRHAMPSASKLITVCVTQDSATAPMTTR